MKPCVRSLRKKTMLDPNICAACLKDSFNIVDGKWHCWSEDNWYLCCVLSDPPRACLKLFEQGVSAAVQSVNIDTKTSPAGGEDP
jgi:hypothetical protein